MTTPDGRSARFRRSFRDLSEDAIKAEEQSSLLTRMGWSGAFGWDELLKSQRILIISEAGAGKTYECRTEQAARWEIGEAAFYFELAELSRANPRDLLAATEEARFDSWLASQSDVATIFLDSVDELKLTLGSFEGALRSLSKALAGQLGRIKVVITTRPIPIDHRLIHKLLPIPEKVESIAGAEAFADVAMSQGRSNRKDKGGETIPAWRTVALMPLSDEQIREMAVLQGVSDADALLQDIRNRNAQDFARRPQDLIELCADWRDFRRIRTHREQVAHNISIKLKPRTDRKEKAQLSAERALEGASRLALASLLTRKLTLRHSAEADRDGDPGTALDPAAILSNWSTDEHQTLLERPLFGFASYGRVRFHHRSVIEYLAAHRLEYLLSHGMSMKAVKRMLFAETPQGIKVVRPSMRPVAAWLAFSQLSIFGEIRDREPGVLLDHADPESLAPSQRSDALHAYVALYGRGGWRGLRVPSIQVHRFASGELAADVLALWDGGIENSEVRGLLLELVAAVPMPECADIAHSIASKSDADQDERVNAFDALIKLDDPRLEPLILSMENDPSAWPDRLIKNLIPRLFPERISVARLCRILSRTTQHPRSVDMLNWLWLPLIAEAEMAPGYLEALRAGLTDLVLDGVAWRQEWPHVTAPRHHLIEPLLAICLRLLKEGGSSAALLHSSVIAIRLGRDEFGRDEPADSLRDTLAKSSSEIREMAFWADDAFNQSLHPQEDSLRRLYEVSHHGAIRLNADQDASWLVMNLADSQRPPAERALALEAAMHNAWTGKGERRDYLLELRNLVSDSPALTARMDEYLKPPTVNRELARMEAEHRKRSEQAKRRRAKDHASWILFWREVANSPQTAFSPDKTGNTAWNLWRAMSRSGEESRASGWNRRFIEQFFSKEVADQLRLAMKSMWRNDTPTLRSERAENEKGTFLIRWQLGLAAVAAEAEDITWARKLSVEEAERAARYAPLELNGFPSWLESLAGAHPGAVDAVLEAELSAELNEIAAANSHSIFLQNVSHAAEPVTALFLPRLRAWFDANAHRVRSGEDEAMAAERLRRIVAILLSHGGDQTREHVRGVAVLELAKESGPAFSHVWLSTLMRLQPALGVEKLEKILENIAPAPLGPGVEWIGILFGERHRGTLVDLRVDAFTATLLLRLVRLAYQHVQPKDDLQHEGTYSPGTRDHAEDGRNALLNALLNATGSEGWEAKLEMARDPLFSHFRDRALLLAREKAAEEADGAALSEPQVIAFDRNREVTPITRSEMFAILVDRLDDIDDLLLRDDSPRDAWAAISEEKVMRREIARALRNSANHVYTVDQEGATADEKETDIRLRATPSDQQAVIELKLGDDRPGRDLRDTLRAQLVTKYMAPEVCRSGCLLVTVSKTRKWDHPDSGERLDLVGLEAMLQAEASQIMNEMGGALLLVARVLDLRPRLPTESGRAATRER